MVAPDHENAPRLLVVDDENAVLKLVKAVLTRADYLVATCTSGAEALRLISQGRFDCVITDAVMPVMSGYDLVKGLRSNRRYHDLPILMLTRQRKPEDVKKAMSAGVNDYVLKPIDEQILLDKVGQCLKKGQIARQVFEAPVIESESKAELAVQSRVISLSESGLVVRLPFLLEGGLPFRLLTPIFADIGIEPPLLAFRGCEEDLQDDVPGFREYPYVARLAFVGLPEPELKKIRTWALRQDIRRRK